MKKVTNMRDMRWDRRNLRVVSFSPCVCLL